MRLVFEISAEGDRTDCNDCVLEGWRNKRRGRHCLLLSEEATRIESLQMITEQVDDDTSFPIEWRGQEANELYKINSTEEIFSKVIPYWEKKGAKRYTKIFRKIGRGICPKSIIIKSYLSEMDMYISLLANETSTSFPYPSLSIMEQPAIFFDAIGVYREYEVIKSKEITQTNNTPARGNNKSVRRGNPQKPV